MVIGVCELHQQTAEVLRRIRGEKMEYIITSQRQPVAAILPVDAAAVEQAVLSIDKQEAAQGWDAYVQIANTVRQRWPEDTIMQALLDEIRR